MHRLYPFLHDIEQSLIKNLCSIEHKKRDESVFFGQTPCGEQVMNGTTHQLPGTYIISMYTIFHLERDEAVEKGAENIYNPFHIGKVDPLGLSPVVESLDRSHKRLMHDHRLLIAIDRNPVEAVHDLVQFAIAHCELPICLAHSHQPFPALLSGISCRLQGYGELAKTFVEQFEQDCLFARKVLIDHRR